ncbi:hypothetical protein [Microbacterium sp. p3-SID336]|uniref:hypothetical protein n=1 Tax=Microbacterium sp. p3-SID336 TaxID=2916212 RepID=UPI0021A91B9D|nr:hypothetical protein [Microbacterium sp. p3-SID336]MCT1479311.1 hypothetical protein [Microbacterium sp. p3-SID336]
MTESRASAALPPPTVFEMSVFIAGDGFARPRYSAISRADSPAWSSAVATTFLKLWNV